MRIFWIVIVLVIVAVAVAEPQSIPYRLAGALNGAIFGAVAGGLAATIQYLIQRKFTAAPITIAMALGFAVGQATEQSINFVGGKFYEQSVRPRVTEEVFARELDAMPIYQAVKRAAPDAYAQLRAEMAKLVAAGAPSKDIENYASNFTANLRRANAEVVLAASPDALAALVKTVTDILDYLRVRDASLCSEYVQQGAQSARIRALFSQKDFAALFERQATTTIDTIAAGRAAKRTYPALSDAEVDLAIQKLQELGWSDEMRAALVDPTKLKLLPPDMVCRIQREWYAALEKLPEPTRTNWYREVLAPLLRS